MSWKAMKYEQDLSNKQSYKIKLPSEGLLSRWKILTREKIKTGWVIWCSKVQIALIYSCLLFPNLNFARPKDKNTAD